jgi:hypothetical protein
MGIQQREIPALEEGALTKKAMLVSITIKTPSTTKKDKLATQEVTKSHLAAEGLARVNKTLFPKEATQGFMQAAREARAAFYESTLPWASPQRILLSSGYFKLMDALDKCRSRFESEQNKFLESYEEQIVGARKELGSLFREEDYPTKEELADKFMFEVHVQPLTDSSDWRVSLGSEAEERIKRQMKAQMEQSFREAAKEPWDRLREVLKAMSSRLSDPEARFAGTLVTNISDLCEVLPDLNIMNDPKLDEIVQQVQEKLASHDPKELRTDMKLRRDTANEAAKMASLVDQYAERS